MKANHRFNRGAWITLAIAIVVMAVTVGYVVYRFSAPTDGWITTEADPTVTGEAGLIAVQDILGVPSSLRAGDLVTHVEGVAYADLQKDPAPAAAWQASQTIRYTVRRDSETLDITVPLTHWTLRGWWNGEGIRADMLKHIGLLLLLFVGGFTFLMRPNNKAAQTLFLVGVFLMFAVAGSAPPGGVVDYVDPIAAPASNILIALIFSVMFSPTLLRFSLLFPAPKDILSRRPWLEALPYLIGALVLIPLIFQQYAFGFLWTLTAALGTITSLIHSAITRRDVVSRAQLRWGVGGLVVGLAIFLSGYLSLIGVVTGPLAAFLDFISLQGFVVIGITLSVAILRYRLFDIDLIIRRTLIYSTITLILAVVYFGVVTLLQTLLADVLGGEGTLSIVISTLAIAALFTPVRRRVQAFVDRRFYRQKYDAAHTLDTFAAAMRDDVDLDRIRSDLLTVVDDTLQPESLSLWLQPLPERRRNTHAGNSSL